MSTTDVAPTTGVAVPSGDGEPRWLSEAETAAWLPLVRLVPLIPQRLDGQLREDAGVGHVHHQILAMLSQARDQQLRMSELAGLTAISPSWLSHAVTALEDRDWVTRCPAATDRRGQLARFTSAGQAAVEQIAPGHVVEVRRLVFDRLTPEEVDQLTRIATTLLDTASR